MKKEILQGFEGIKKLEKGVEKLTNAVKITLGPKGKNVILSRGLSTPLITNDGVTIAREIELEDKFENMGASIIKQASIETNEVAGDGTTTACVIANSIVHDGVKNYTAGANPIDLKNGIKIGLNKALEYILHSSTQIKDNDIFNIASISAQDEEIGKLIADAYAHVGRDGVITVEEGKSIKTELKLVEGMQFDRGYISPHMITDKEKMSANLEDAYILITDYKIKNINDILPILEKVSEARKPLLIICDDMDSEVVSTLVLNKLRGVLNVAVVRAPYFADRRTATLQDIATLTHAKYISIDTADDLSKTTINDLGQAKSIRVTKDSTIITGGAGNKSDIIKRAEIIKGQISVAKSDFDKEMLKTRLAKLTGCIGVIYVGCATDVELMERKLRIEDALSATKSAVAEGIVAGGGVTLLRASIGVEALASTLPDDQKTGCKIVANALRAPILQICANCGADGSVVINNILACDTPTYGYNAKTNEYCDMLQCGIIDPTLVTRSALINACSVASTLLTTDCLVADTDNN